MLKKQQQPTCKRLSQLSALPLPAPCPTHPNTLPWSDLQTFHYRHLLFSAYLEESTETTLEAEVNAVTGAPDANQGPLEGWHCPFLILCSVQGQAADCGGSE